MNLQPVNPADPNVRVCCSRCSIMVQTGWALADLDAKPGTYYCPTCAGVIVCNNSPTGAKEFTCT